MNVRQTALQKRGDRPAGSVPVLLLLIALLTAGAGFTTARAQELTVGLSAAITSMDPTSTICRPTTT